MSWAFDPILLEVLWNRLIAVVEEQARTLMRTSFTSVVRESGDLSAGVFDRRGRMVAQAITGTPGHINAMATCIHHFLADYPAATLRPGDALITNNPQQTSGHLNDFTVITPIFRRGDGPPTLVAFFGNTCHALDVGGRIWGADSRQVYEEGLHVPITKLFSEGHPNEELLRIVRANVRTPQEVVGDLYAQATSNEVGGVRLLEMMAEFGLPNLEALSDEILGRSEAAMRAAIGALPDGEYRHQTLTDGFDEPILLKVAVTIRGDTMRVDFTGSAPQSRYGINVVLNYTQAYATFGVKCAISPDVPNNEGSFRPVQVTAPEGSILNAMHPAPVGARHIVGHFLPGLIHGALAPVIADRVMAEGAASLWNTQVTGRTADGRPFTYVFFSGGGTGARATKDGLSATAFPSGIRGVPAEVVETLSPLLMRRRELRADSEGPGRTRGGFGQDMELEVLSPYPYVLSPMYDRTRFPAKGMAGGGDGAPGALLLQDGTALAPKRLHDMAAGTRLTLLLPGGGGYGSPLRRDPAAVLQDVLNGLVSPERARAAYGVVLESSADEPPWRVDVNATAQMRQRLSEAMPDR